MKSILRFAALAAMSAAWISVACSSAGDDDDDTTGGTSSVGGDDNSAGGDDSSAGTGNSAGGQDSAGGANEGGGPGDAGGAGGSGGSGSGTPIEACDSAVLFAGNPLFEEALPPDAGWNTAGQGLFEDPPLRYHALEFIGDRMFVDTEQELWSADLSAATPVISRLAGEEGVGFINAGVPCADTEFLVIKGMTKTADGKLVIVDYIGGAVIEITDPGGPNCQSHWVAGTHERTEDPGSDYPLAQGDRDGPGAQALFGFDEAAGIKSGIMNVATDPAGNIYVFDDATSKFKKIGTDDERTVETIGQAPGDDSLKGLAFLNGKLYAAGVDGTNDVLIEVDPATYDAASPSANVKDVFRNRDQFPEIESSRQAVLGDLTTDGEALIIVGVEGYIWRVAADGTVLATLGGAGNEFDFPAGFDPKVPHPADEWQFRGAVSNGFGGPWLALNDTKLYWAGGRGTGLHIVEFSCP